MSNSSAEEPPYKKKKLSLTPSFSSLPDEMIVNCLAQVSRSDQAAVSMVCKSYRSLMASPELHKTRWRLGCVENCLLTPPDPAPRWFVLRRGKLFMIPSSPSQVLEAFSVVVLDWGIYVIGGSIDGNPLRMSGYLIACRIHTWHYIPLELPKRLES